jgi:G:T-mismatch repair DNA endonuclease (very short patch repair protein)
MKEIKYICEYCGKEFLDRSHGNKKRRFCSKVCAGQKGIKKGKYSDFQVSQMSKAKSEAQFKRWRHLLVDDAEDIIRQYINQNYISSYIYLTEKVIKEENRIAEKITRKIIQKLGLQQQFEKTPQYPDFIQKLTLNKYNELLNAIITKSWAEIKIWAIENNISLRFFGKFWYMTKDIISYYDKDIWYEKFGNIFVKVPHSRLGGTLPETVFENLLKDNNLQYKKQYILPCNFNKTKRVYYDFFIEDKLFVEVNGDFWHNWDKLKEYNNSHDQQLEVIDENDILKKEIVEKLGFKIIYFWEHELIKDRHNKLNKENFVNIIKRVKDALND